MYRIVILTNDTHLGELLSQWAKCFCAERRFFPTIELHKDTASLCQSLRFTNPDGVIVALPGVEGLNAVEHLRMLCPRCGVIWCSELDFSLQAYRLRAEYFIKAPATDAELRQGLGLWLEQKRLGTARSNADGTGQVCHRLR